MRTSITTTISAALGFTLRWFKLQIARYGLRRETAMVGADIDVWKLGGSAAGR